MGGARGSGEKGSLALQQESAQSDYQEAFVNVGGVPVHYLHVGIGTPMLLIHGLIGSSANWRNNIAALAQKAHVYAIDLLNMGKSERVEGLDASLKATANHIVAVMDSLGLAEADIVAHSYGGAIALMAAALHPRRVRRLILFAPANPYCQSSGRIVRVYCTAFGRLVARMLPYFPAPLQRIALGQRHSGPDRIVDSRLREMVDGLRCPGTLQHVLSILQGWFTEMSSLKAALHRVARIPTLLVWGDRDRTVSLASGIRLNHKLRASELIVLPGGHSVYEQSPEESNRIVLNWLDRQPSPAPGPSTVFDSSASRLYEQANPVSIAAEAMTAPDMQHPSPGT